MMICVKNNIIQHHFLWLAKVLTVLYKQNTDLRQQGAVPACSEADGRVTFKVECDG